MGEKEAFDAHQQAVRELASRPDRQPRHEDAIRIYLAGITYAESHPRPAPHAQPKAPTDEPAQPVDEPAPYAPRTTRRR